ncbi:MAG: hypothetical protein ACLTOJ_14820 [[Clostridium] symbiosum]
MNVAKAYAGILEEELVPAMGCTEPIAIAYAAAIAWKFWRHFRRRFWWNVQEMS